MFLYKILFHIYSFNPNDAYWNQRRLFSGNLPGMFTLARGKAEKFKFLNAFFHCFSYVSFDCEFYMKRSEILDFLPLLLGARSV